VQIPVEKSAEVGENSGAQLVLSTPPAPLTTEADEARDTMAAADSIPGKAPAFQFYPNDFLSDANVICMSLQERGAYITLICVCWQQGTLPTNIDQLARFCGTPIAVFRKLWPAVEKCFKVSGERLTHPRLERERKKQREFRKLQSDKGKASAASRKATTVEPGLNHGSPPVAPRLQPKPNSSSSSSSSSSDSGPKEHARDPVQRLVDRHEELHRQYVGVGYLGNPHKDYDAARNLVKAFPEVAMQDAILIYGLNDPSDFMANGTRTIGKIASRASDYAQDLKARKLA
jgi:uncharacterized protein YdaU (DUF1376 family)